MAAKKTERMSMNMWWFLAAGLLVIAVLVVGTVINQNGGLTTSESRLGRVLDNPEQYYGQNIDVVGEVEQVKGSRAFILDTPQPLSDRLLVISRESLQPIGGGPEQFLFNPQDRVEVRGEVREFRIREVEQALGVDLVDEEFLEWEGRPVMIADEVTQNR